MSVAGAPQWFNIRELNTGTNNDQACVNGLENVAVSGGAGSLFPGKTFATSTKTLTAGPQTTGPVLVQVNGLCYTIPWNTSVTLEQFIWDALGTSGTVWTYA